MRKHLSLLAALAGLLAGACAPRPSLYGDVDRRMELHDVRVEAGDHLTIDGRKVLLADAETPQPGARSACRAETIAAQDVAELVRSQLRAAQHIEVHSAGAGELALVNLDGLDLGQTLIGEGVAIARGASGADWCGAGARG